MSNVLMIVTAADSITLTDGSSHPTGYWAEELVTTHRTLVEAGHAVTVASPGGGRAVVDALSLDPEMAGGEDEVARLQAYLDSISDVLDAPARLSDQKAEDFDGVVVPGGHGPMVDLVDDSDVRRLLRDTWQSGRLVGALCHGPAALLAATDDGANVFAGRTVTSFTGDEEAQGGLADACPWLVDERLAEAGMTLDRAEAWTSHVVTDGRLVTGQNPQSSAEFAQAYANAL